MFCTPGNSDVPGRPRISLKYTTEGGPLQLHPQLQATVSRWRASEPTNERASSSLRRWTMEAKKGINREIAERGSSKGRTNERAAAYGIIRAFVDAPARVLYRG